MKSLPPSQTGKNRLPEALLSNRRLFELTLREWHVLIHVADDLTKTQIAVQLGLTEKSVQNYRNRISSKLDLPGRDNLARFARKHANDLHRWYELWFSKLPLPEI